MAFIDEQLKLFKTMIENAIITGGVEGKASIIRSSHLINLIHDAVKFELINTGVDSNMVMPHFRESSPEVKLAGFLKQKDQDICVLPHNIEKKTRLINWGPLGFLDKEDQYGEEFSTNTLVINVRSQMSSLAKNADTLFERTFAEALNLHMKYPNMVLGEVYLIPLYEYDDSAVRNRIVAFKERQTNIERYISFFNSINGRNIGEEDYKYERCALLIVDFAYEQPILFRNSRELKDRGLVAQNFNIEYANLSFDTFAKDITDIYAKRYNINNLRCH